MSKGKTEKKSLFDKVLDLDSRIIFLLLLIVLVVPIAKPIGFPIAVSPYSQKLYNYVEGLKPGSLVLFWSEMGWGWWPAEYRPGTVAIVQRLIEKGVKFIAISGVADDPLIWNYIVTNILDLKDYKYGTDYLVLGYYAGVEAARANFAKNINAMVSVDYIQNKPIDQFPIMNGVTNAKSFDLVIEISSTPAEITIRQFYTAYGTPCGFIGSAGMFSDYLPYFASGQIIGFTCGLSGGAEFEFLFNKPRWGMAALDALSTSHILMVILLCLSNVIYFIKRSGRMN
jgi:hypothetical protein